MHLPTRLSPYLPNILNWTDCTCQFSPAVTQRDVHVPNQHCADNTVQETWRPGCGQLDQRSGFQAGSAYIHTSQYSKLALCTTSQQQSVHFKHYLIYDKGSMFTADYCRTNKYLNHKTSFIFCDESRVVENFNLIGLSLNVARLSTYIWLEQNKTAGRSLLKLDEVTQQTLCRHVMQFSTNQIVGFSVDEWQ